MVTMKEYVRVQSLEEAYELNQKKRNRIIGGMLWLKMSRGNIQTAIDLSDLGLDDIEETEEAFSIGCMATLRSLELHPGLNAYTKGAVRESLRHIVGVQFRNLATLGGSIYGRFGFSDVLTMFLALDTYVELYKKGVVSLQEFAAMPRDNDILVRLIVKKKPLSCAYLSHRNAKTDFPVLACAFACLDGVCQVSIGARPGRAVLVSDEMGILKDGITEETAAAFGAYAASQIVTGTNMRASADYRKHLARVLVKRAALAALGGVK